LRLSRKRPEGFGPFFFQELGESTSLLQPAWKSNATAVFKFLIFFVNTLMCLELYLNLTFQLLVFE